MPIITAPITDYIPASLLTTNGDTIARQDGLVVAKGCGTHGEVKSSQGVGLNIISLDLSNALNFYMKGAGVAVNPTFAPLALRDTGIHIANFGQSAAGNQVITGVGFTASVIIFLAVDTITGDVDMSWGFDNGTIHMCQFQHTNGTEVSVNTTRSINIYLSASHHIEGYVSAIGADGFTITWTLTGTRGASIVYLCLP